MAISSNLLDYTSITNTSSCSVCRPFKALLTEHAADNCVVLSIDNEPVTFSVGMQVASSPNGDLILLRNGRPLEIAMIQAMRDEFTYQTGTSSSPGGGRTIFRQSPHGGLAFNASSVVDFYKYTDPATSLDRQECQSTDIVRGDHVVVMGTSIMGVHGIKSVDMNEMTLIHRP